MTNDTTTRSLTEILADLADFTVANTGTRAIALYHELEDAARAQLAPLPPEVEAELAAQADHDARTMAPPVPGVTQNAGYTVRAVYHAHDAVPGLLGAWWVACENADTGQWVTWNAYEQDGSQAGKLAYDGGHYFPWYGPDGDPAENKHAALADLAIRAGTMNGVARRLASDVLGWTYAEPEDKRMARRLLRYITR